MHNKHHKYCDKPEDPHSITQTNWFYAFCGWTFWETDTEWKYVRKNFMLPELFFINYFHFIPKMSLVYILWKYINYSWCFYLYILPSTICALGVLQFNIGFHPSIKKNVILLIKKKNHILLVYLAGETYHNDHHKFPNKYHRLGLDLPYYFFIYPQTRYNKVLIEYILKMEYIPNSKLIKLINCTI